jgi:hypothetical protein
VNVILSAVVLTIVGLALLIVLGAAAYSFAMVVAEGLASLFSDVRDRLLPRTTGAAPLGVTETHPQIVTRAESSRAEAPEPSAEAMWHRMQGTSKKSRRTNTPG